MSHFITLTAGTTITSRFRTNRETILATGYKNLNILPLSETFTRDELDEILAQDDCRFIRIYYSMDSSYRVHAVIVGADSNEKDILPGGNEKLMENSRRCPTDCPPESPLNA